jgi:ribose 5-phosphate isomerase RpiB
MGPSAVGADGEIRGVICHDTCRAHQGFEHDDMSVLVIGSRIVGYRPISLSNAWSICQLVNRFPLKPFGI